MEGVVLLVLPWSIVILMLIGLHYLFFALEWVVMQLKSLIGG